jgi:DNA-binding CsgD family transcriptional regulator
MFWDRVLAEVLNKNNKKRLNQRKYTLTNILHKNLFSTRKLRQNYQPKTIRTYLLGEQLQNVYLTKREAECMFLLLKGKSINTIAEVLKLSPRTIEYYLKNMKSKLNCHSKFELIDLIQHSEFIRNVDFEF